MADKYLNTTGLGYYHDRIKTLFASQADLDTLDAKVDEIVAEGGEPNVIETVKVNGTALTPDANKAVNVETPTVTIASDGEATIAAGASDYIIFAPQANGTLSVVSAYDGSEQYENTLATTAYVDANGGKIDHVAVNGTDLTITNKRVNVPVPTVVSDLTNDSGYQTATEVQTAISAAVTSAYKYKGSVATYADLPSTGQATGDVWDVQADGMNYAWNGSAWDALGSYVDTSLYWAKADLVAITTAEIDALFA